MDKFYRGFMAFLPIFIGVSGAFSVLFGAWLAHASGALSESAIDRVSSGHLYQFLHTIVLLVLWLGYQYRASAIIALSALAITLGILFFSGSLYLKTFLNISEIGAFAPYGGMSFAVGWLLLVLLGKRS